DDRRFFDPERYRIILFDQRGCGRSTPHASLENNTTHHLVQDMEDIRERLGIQRWMLFGGSWGSTLSLAYAQKYPERVMGLILRGIFLCRPQDFKWFYQEGANHIFPDYWQEFLLPIPQEERGDLIRAYHDRLVGGDEVARMNAAKHWAQWEGQCATLNPCKTVYDRLTNPHTALSLSCIETRYFLNNAYLEPDQLLKDAHKLENIPGIIVHGRYDMICPLDNAYVLHQAWPRSELHVVRDAGHSTCDPGISCALVNATNIMARYHE
ncbi:MAG TPA: prolyl aminopeptidase, partial [Gammaproteobacteria bacterium]|nr:prolyl aminopeptidase [Gammaproteobacteria bacterium]